MLRAVLAVTLATALLAASLPAIEEARRNRASATLRAETGEIASAVRDLRASDATVQPGERGARRVVTIQVPARDWTTAGVDALAIGGRRNETRTDAADSRTDRNETAFAWQVDGEVVQTRRLPGVRIEHADGDGDDDPLVLREPGRYRLALTLVDRAGNRTVVVRELSGPT